MELIPRKIAEEQVLHLQRKFFRWSKHDEFSFGRIYNLLYNPFVLSLAWYLLCGNQGSRTPGVDGVTVKTVKNRIGVVKWLSDIEHQLRERTFEPDLVRRSRIEKQGKPGQYRDLGIATLADRLVQMSAKLVLEPIFEARFKQCSFGFRPRRSAHDAIARIYTFMHPRYKYEWVVEADFRSCFDNINHGLLRQEIRKTVRDKRILALIRAFLKAGVMEDESIRHPVSGTPQGGIISPLLANIYLSQLDALYTRFHSMDHNERRRWRKRGLPMIQYTRYADDFVILVQGTREHAEAVLSDLRLFVRDALKMELAEEKTGILHVKEGFDFLGYHLRLGKSQCADRPARVLRPSRKAIMRFRRKIKELTSKRMVQKPLKRVLVELNRVIRGWGQYFRYGTVSRLFGKLDWYVKRRIYLWLRKKYARRTYRWLRKQFYHPNILGRRRWTSEGVSIRLLQDQFRPTHFRGVRKKLSSPYELPTYQTTFRDFFPKLGPLRFMEGVLQRLRPVWRAQ